jgi:hypothetical protein
MKPLSWCKIQTMRKWSLLVLMLFSLAACAAPVTTTPAPAPTLTPSEAPVILPSQTASATITLPTATQTPPRVILVAPPQADGDIKLDLRSALTEMAAAAGFGLLEQTSLSTADLDESTRIVIVLPPFSDLNSLLARAEHTQFVAVGISGLPAAANLTVIGASGFRPDQQAFLAGYMAAITSQDWRAGALTDPSPEGQTASSAFENGVRFFCGLCKPSFPPFFTYPQTFQVAVPADKESWTAAADQLVGRGVQVVYVAPGISSPDLLQYLMDAELNLIGGMPPPYVLRSNWIATVRADPVQALRKLWNDLLAGKGGQQIPMPLVFTDTESGLLSAARQRLVQETLDKLVLGTINPNNVPEP